ncbi:MAG: GNAT family N-acetyltransferase [Planctomycetaceae bacterium]|nr:GNAT family N-acetyltransferase [Planctomycetaceae bacterium]
MAEILEFNQIEPLAEFRTAWRALLRQTAGHSFFQSLEWLEIYWRHYGVGQRLRVLVVLDGRRPTGILPLTVLYESTWVGRVRTLTYPLSNWGSFYGPIGPDPLKTLAVGLNHVQHTPRDWDVLELRWHGQPNDDPAEIRRVLREAGLQAYSTHWDRTAVVDMAGDLEAYWASRKGTWLRRLRQSERHLARQGPIVYERYRPQGPPHDDGAPRWDLYNACEEIARRSWQGRATDGTTLSHPSIREFLRETHAAAALLGMVDLNLLRIDGQPAAFIYGYHADGVTFGLRRGYDADRSRQGAGTVLLARTLADSFQRGDRLYDMGVGSLPSKRPFQTRLAPIWRFSHYEPSSPRTQILRVKRWWQSRQTPASIAVGRVQDVTADLR